MGISDLIERTIGKEKAIEFAIWAFSDEYADLLLGEFHLIWNYRHGEKLKLHGNGLINVDIPKMIEIWEKETKREV